MHDTATIRTGLHFICVIIAVLCFGGAMLGAKSGKVNLTEAGLLAVTLALFVV